MRPEHLAVRRHGGAHGLGNGFRLAVVLRPHVDLEVNFLQPGRPGQRVCGTPADALERDAREFGSLRDDQREDLVPNQCGHPRVFP